MTILVLPGDGIGPEITRATIAVLEAADRRFGLGLDFEHHDIGFAALEKHGTTLPDAVLERAAASDGILLGPISHLDYPARDRGGVNVSAAIRVKLDLYANVRPARTREGVPNVVGPFDLVIMRECTEGFYPDRNMYAGTGEFMPDKDMALSVRKITARACERIARRAFELARTRRQEGDRDPQGQQLHPQRRAVPARGPAGGRRVSRRGARREDRRRQRRAAGARSAPVRRDLRHQLPCRHPVGPRLRALRRAGPRGLGQHERGAVLRAGAARLGARHRGAGPGQSDLADPVGGDAARLDGRASRIGSAAATPGAPSIAPSTPRWPRRRRAPPTWAARWGRRRSPPRWRGACNDG